jgi:hypothetical protein
MALSTSINVHDVKTVTLEHERENRSVDDVYVTRSIIIETDNGQIEISLFSKRKSLLDDGPCMQVIV